MSAKNGVNGATAPAAKPRLQIQVTEQQKAMIVDAAQRSGSDINAWVVAQAMRAVAIKPRPGESAPLVISGPVADRVRMIAEQQGISTDRVVEQLLLSYGDD